MSDYKDDFGIRTTKRLPVSGAYYTPLMNPTFEVMRDAVGRTALSNPRIPVYSCMEGKVYTSAYQIRKWLPKQACSANRWEMAMHALFKYTKEEYVPRTYECGPGQTLCGILYKVNGKAGKKAVSVLI